MIDSINIISDYMKDGVIEFDANETDKKQFQVLINGCINNTGFRYSTIGDDWFNIVAQNDNIFIISVKENFDLNDRIGCITIHHNNIQGEDGEKVIQILQKGIECGINIEKNEFVFLPFPYDTLYETVDVEIKTEGGNRKYFIKSIKEFNENGNVITNDNGINVMKVNNETLRITSYGRVFVNDGCYYKITIAHDNDASKEQEITVNYVPYTIDDEIKRKNNVESFGKIRDYKFTKHDNGIPLNSEIITGLLNTNEEGYLSFEDYDISKHRVRRKKSLNDDEIIFDNTGGVRYFKINSYPENSPISVKISSDFATYKIKNGVLILTVDKNPYNSERRCLIKIKNSNNQVKNIKKIVIQKGIQN